MVGMPARCIPSAQSMSEAVRTDVLCASYPLGAGRAASTRRSEQRCQYVLSANRAKVTDFRRFPTTILRRVVHPDRREGTSSALSLPILACSPRPHRCAAGHGNNNRVRGRRHVRTGFFDASLSPPSAACLTESIDRVKAHCQRVRYCYDILHQGDRKARSVHSLSSRIRTPDADADARRRRRAATHGRASHPRSRLDRTT
ncbi:hypothetical protein L226DRAFT_155274 [Lentinus tigrinus ALCF2SS1-7]|uniref:uncharacterized protein n=1 Tax=Lentinus tigrinus ALCF2SS1-7 TaxID=1328758 RepID=UPI0011661BBA|nr:hypothetical protein L226DRAFT_155274 [Lentinus tigrinus ALCF2SS1-7]